MTPIPVTLLTGFLGSGKTTLLGRVLRDPRFSDTAVIINEFGEVGLDHVLVEAAREDRVQMSSGCLCCTIRGDIRQTLLSLHARLQAGSAPTFTRVIIETTGLADPAPVLHTLIADAAVQARYALSGVVATVDAVNGEATLANHGECVKQIAVADRIVLTKSDLARDPASRGDVAALLAVVRRLNPGAAVLDRNDSGFDVRRLCESGPYDPFGKGLDVQRWLNEEAFRAEEERRHHQEHAHGHRHDDGQGQGHDREPHHDVNRHGPDIHAFCIVRDQPLSGLAFTLALELLIANRGEDLLRVKGIVNLAGSPGRPCVIHGVQHVFHDPVWLEQWPSEDHRSRIVFITRGLPRHAIEPVIAAFSGLPPGLSAAAGGEPGGAPV